MYSVYAYVHCEEALTRVFRSDENMYKYLILGVSISELTKLPNFSKRGKPSQSY